MQVVLLYVWILYPWVQINLNGKYCLKKSVSVPKRHLAYSLSNYNSYLHSICIQ